MDTNQLTRDIRTLRNLVYDRLSEFHQDYKPVFVMKEIAARYAIPSRLSSVAVVDQDESIRQELSRRFATGGPHAVMAYLHHVSALWQGDIVFVENPPVPFTVKAFEDERRNLIAELEQLSA